MLHLGNDEGCFGSAKEATDIALSRPEAYATDTHAATVTLGAFRKLILLLDLFPVECTPLATTPTHVAWNDPRPSAFAAKNCGRFCTHSAVDAALSKSTIRVEHHRATGTET